MLTTVKKSSSVFGKDHCFVGLVALSSASAPIARKVTPTHCRFQSASRVPA